MSRLEIQPSQKRAIAIRNLESYLRARPRTLKDAMDAPGNLFLTLAIEWWGGVPASI